MWHINVVLHNIESCKVKIIPFSISSQIFLIKTRRVLASMAQLIGASSCSQRIVESTSGQGAGFHPSPGIYNLPAGCMIPGLGAFGMQSIHASLLHLCFLLTLPFFLALSLKAMKKCPW